MVHTRAQRRGEVTAEHSMTGGCATLPDELMRGATVESAAEVYEG
jgi:hypothetical protein